ncbi:type II toxin-antitoxin system RatA family toxin [Pelistega europaea]|uniref:Type II toxin-antitoxin system RatA family toxin n=1 Tax=Pelistega europaea TaxID=106147 RepID=A0A7Y4L8M2_9BURK|nr:type II toxin-antitoxin system RatA family toxin [Pelistega europaea]NOL48947.1 type II toxin-antitoxin system RatA family toxin [Pelistega europaea]
MQTVKRSVLVPYSAEQMFDLVAAVDKYPEFMPWCGGAQIKERTEQGLVGSVTISFAKLTQTFTTRNTHHYPHKITLQLVDGPFSSLHGTWEFIKLDEKACKVVFTLDYDFSNRALALVIGPVFNRIANSFIDSFTQRAKAIYR